MAWELRTTTAQEGGIHVSFTGEIFSLLSKEDLEQAPLLCTETQLARQYKLTPSACVAEQNQMKLSEL